MLEFARNLFRRRTEPPGLAFSRPLVVLQSDDWGRVGVRDHEGFERLRSSGLRLGERPYDLYTLETATDVASLCSLLGKHRDSRGRPPCLVMNFCLANLDFPKMRQQGFTRLELLPLSQGLPGSWSRPGLLDSYRAGIRQGVLFPAAHGLTHFCALAVEHALAENQERAQLLRLLWSEETPYIYWRMPWTGYEYWDPERRGSGFIPAERQQSLIQNTYEVFLSLFGTPPTSACAPGDHSNAATHRAWSECGIRVSQSGTASGLKAPYIDHMGILHLYRSIDFEPYQKEVDIEKYLQVAAGCFSRGLPLIISIHSINFHSSMKDFRTSSLAALDTLLTALESKHPELLYVNDDDVYAIATEGTFGSRDDKTAVLATYRERKLCAIQQGAL